MRLINLKENKQSDAINQSVKVLAKGGLVIFPSDTVYALLADAANEKAIKKLIAFKNRPVGKAIAVFVKDFPMMNNVVKVSNQQLDLLKKLLPGCFTVVLKSKHNVSRLLESEKGTLGARIPDYKLINDLVDKFNRPITATSANLASKPPHYKITTLLNELSDNKKELIDLIVDAGDLPRHKPSTVLDLTTLAIKILRQGDMSPKEEITYISKSPDQTKKIAKQIVKKLRQKAKTNYPNKPLALIIEGELGVGKTVFVKGIGELLGINNIISPSFVVYYEYETKDIAWQKLIHFDLYNVQENDEFQYLGIGNYFQPGNLLVFEWGEKTGKIFNLLKRKAEIFYVKIDYINENSRNIRFFSYDFSN